MKPPRRTPVVPPPPARARSVRGRAALVAAAILLLALAGVLAGRNWRERRTAGRLQAAVPGLPDLAGRPAALQEALARAKAKVADRATARQGVIELGSIFHANGYYVEAEACWMALRALEPANGRWSHLLADVKRSTGETEGLEALLQEAVARAPDYSPAWLRLADQEFKLGRLDAAAAHYRKRLGFAPGDTHARLGLARIAQQRGEASEARRIIDELVREQPGFPPAQNLLAEMLEAAGDAAGARQHRWLGRQAGRFQEAPDAWLAELRPWCFDPPRLYVLGTAEFQTESGDRGRGLIERAVQLAPEKPDGHDLLGDLYLKLGEPAKARKSLETALQLFAARGTTAPVSTYVNLSESCRRLGQLQDAMRVIDEGLARTGGAFELYNARGVTLSASQRKPEAIAAYREGLQRNPNDADTNFNLAVELLEIGLRDEAVACLRRSLTLQPGFPKSLILLGRLDLDAGRLDSSRAYLQQLYEANPGVPQVRQIYARWFVRAGESAAERRDAAAAERLFREGLALAPDDPTLGSSLGLLLLTQGRFDEAVAPLEAVQRAEPENPQHALMLGQAYARLGRKDDARRVLLAGEQAALRAGNSRTAGYCREILGQL